MEDIQVIDDFIPKPIQDRIEELVCYNAFFNWYYNSSSNYGSKKPEDVQQNMSFFHKSLFDCSNSIDYPQFTHTLYRDGKPQSDFFHEFVPTVSCLPFSVESIIRMKLNLTFPIANPTKELTHGMPHIDFEKGFEYKTIIYYVNDSDGDTFVFNEKVMEDKLPEKLTVMERVQPKKNRVVLFESNRFHASSNPLVSTDRFVINFVFKTI